MRKICFVLNVKVFSSPDCKTTPIYSIRRTCGRISIITTIYNNNIIVNIWCWQEILLNQFQDNNFCQQSFLLKQFLLWTPVPTISSFFVHRLLDVSNRGNLSPERRWLSGLCKFMNPWTKGTIGWLTKALGKFFLDGDPFDTTVAAISIVTMVIVNTLVQGHWGWVVRPTA